MADRSNRRARSAEAKQERAEQLLDALRELLDGQHFVEVNAARIAAHAGLSKGTLFRYFPTKESLGLALLERELDGWAGALENAVRRVGPRGSPVAVAAAVVESLRGRGAFVHLLSLLGAVLEQNVDEETLRAFRHRLDARLRPAAARLDRALPWLEPGQALAFLLLLHAMIVGIHQVGGSGPAVRRVLEEPALAPFRLDLEDTLRSAVESYLTGLRERMRRSLPGTAHG